MTFGLTIKMLTISEGWGLTGVPFPSRTYIDVFGLVGLWFLQVIGYIAFAAIEERSLTKKYAEFKQYKQNVPFLFPIKNPTRFPDAAFTVMLITGACILLLLLPYRLIKEFSTLLFP